MTALLTEDVLAERFAAQIRAANTATQRAFAAVLDPLLGAVDLTVIAEHLAEDAAEKFGGFRRAQGWRHPASWSSLLTGSSQSASLLATKRTVCLMLLAA